MSRFFDISPTTTIDLDEVEAIRADTPTETSLIINGKEYKSAFPFQTIKSIVQSSTQEQERRQPEINRFQTDPAW